MRPNKKTIGRGGDGEMGRTELVSGSRINTTGESIVREFRSQNSELRLPQVRNAESKPVSTFQPYRVLPQAQPSLVHQIFHRINWAKIFDIVCMGLAILAIAAISGVMFFGPISWREFVR